MDYVSLKEAARLTGKAEITIRRLTKKPAAAGHVRHDQPDQRLMISLNFLRSQFPLKNAPLSEENVITAPRSILSEDDQPDHSDYSKQDRPNHSDYTEESSPDQDDHTHLISLLQEQITELKKDKEYLQEILRREQELLAREQDKSKNLLLQAINGRSTAEQQFSNESTTTDQRPATKKALLYSLLLAVFLLFAALAYQLSRPSTLDQRPINDKSTINQQPINDPATMGQRPEKPDSLP